MQWFTNGIVTLIGAFMGFCLFSFIGHPLIAVFLGIFLILILRTVERKIVNIIFKNVEFTTKFKKLDWIAHVLFLLAGSTFFGIRSSIPVFYVLGFLHVFAVLLLIFKLLKDVKNLSHDIDTKVRISVLFFVSGFAALIYQIAWQRALFQVYGVNTESVTIIVSIFMLGLGAGSMVGGFLSKKFPNHSIKLFLGFEIGAALFGIFSLKLIHFVGDLVITSGPLNSTLSIYLLLSIPTMCMGATLPVLVSYLHRMTKNIGQSMSILYFINTLGSAVASFATVDLFFVLFGLQTTIYLAAFCNFLVVILVYLFIKKSENNLVIIDQKNATKNSIPFIAALGIAFLTGYISLSQEILWVRAIGFTAGGMPQVFGQVLGSVLIGVAFGALFADYLCRQDKIKPLIIISGMLLISSIAYYFAMPLISLVFIQSLNGGLIFSYFTVALIAGILGGALIIISHYGIEKNHQVGLAVSWIYMANIIGATMGPLFTEFVLLDRFTLIQNIVGLVIFSIIAAAILTIWYGRDDRKMRNFILSGVAVFGLILFFTHHFFYNNLITKMQFKRAYTPKTLMGVVVENKTGIATSAPDPILNSNPFAHIIYGGGVFDGVLYTNKDVARSIMAIQHHRLFIIGALHPHPKEVLQIAMSAGFWTQILSGYESIEHLDVVELNPGYLELAKHYPGYELYANNPKVSIHIDDGRRWLRKNPHRKFDMIILDTPHHFRSQVSSILSTEFVKLCKEHLKENGVYYQTVTASEDAIFTGAQNFKYIVPYENMYAASDTPFAMTVDEKADNFAKFKYFGGAIFSKDKAVNEKTLDELIHHNLRDRGEEYRQNKDLIAITDDNMLTEFKRPVSRLTPFYQWRQVKKDGN